MTDSAENLSSILLNPEQREAVDHFEGPCLVLAGAGSGKTRVLTTRVGRLILEHGVPPDRILAVTFTNKAAGEMRSRVAAMLGSEPRGIWISTFHAFGARLLRRHAPERGWTRAFAIRDAEQSLREIRKAQISVDVDPQRYAPRAVREAISRAKNELVAAEAFAKRHGEDRNPLLRRVARVYPVYQRALKGQDAMDFDDLLVEPVRLLEADDHWRDHYRDAFAFILVDEYQDTNRAQFRLLELLAGERGNLMVVGDDDQSIYGWRGADVGNILSFERKYAGARVVRLERNYRSSGRILDAANRVIRQNLHRKEKTMRPHRGGGPPVTLLEAGSEREESRWIVAEIDRTMLDRPELGHGDFAVLYRTNAQARSLEDRFRQRAVPYQIVGGVRFYERREIQDLLAYLRLIANPRDMDAFDRAVNYPRRGVGRKTLTTLGAYARGEGVDLFEAAAGADRVAGLPSRSRLGLLEFAEVVRRYGERARRDPPGELLQDLVSELGILELLRAEGIEGDDRANNALELVAAAEEFEPEQVATSAEDRQGLTDLDLFLQHVALVTDLDQHEDGADAVTLMTLHGAKGLEFPVVFVVGLEEGLLPLARAREQLGGLDEERRLFYVGITRAMDKLYLTHARRRRRAGQISFAPLSSFVDPLDGIVERGSVGVARRPRGLGGRREWHREGTRGSPADSPAYGDQGDEWGFDQDLPGYVKGERVAHSTFGSGTIVELSGYGPDMKVTVDFDGVGRKKLIVRYAQLARGFP
ncbi:MAG: UvrD-helicase domain-containing protein [Gemmatimonadetes bacterium]|nr:UvrD-helicase domain-containing protein [Gemmatimonadota bacterium]